MGLSKAMAVERGSAARGTSPNRDGSSEPVRPGAPIPLPLQVKAREAPLFCDGFCGQDLKSLFCSVILVWVPSLRKRKGSCSSHGKDPAEPDTPSLREGKVCVGWRFSSEPSVRSAQAPSLAVVCGELSQEEPTQILSSGAVGPCSFNMPMFIHL